MGQHCSVCLETKLIHVFKCPSCKTCVCKKCVQKLHYMCPVCERSSLNIFNLCSSCKNETALIRLRPCMNCCYKCHCVCKKPKRWFDAF